MEDNGECVDDSMDSIDCRLHVNKSEVKSKFEPWGRKDVRRLSTAGASIRRIAERYTYRAHQIGIHWRTEEAL